MSEYLLRKKIDVVILCGGLGTRIKKISKRTPKSLIKINNKNILNYILNEVKKYNFNKIYLLTGYKSRLFRKYNKINSYFIPIECIEEKKLMGTGGALYNLKKKKINDFILINGDSMLSMNYLTLIEKNKDKIGSISLTRNYNYKSNKKLANLSLKKNLVKFGSRNNLMNGGVYFFKKKILNYIYKKKFSLETDLLENLIKKEKINGSVFSNFFLDIGTSKNLKKAPKLLYNEYNKPAAFFDRDGVINYDYGHVSKYKNFVLRPGVLKGLKLLNQKNFLIFIVTNQAGIAKNIFKENDFIKLQLKFKNYLLKKNIFINDVVYCPHHSKGVLKKYKISCNCRKPKNGMVNKILSNYDINKLKSFMIGDKKSDEKCAQKSKIYFEYVKNNFYQQIRDIVKKK